jgi:L-ectoine synthase
MKIATNVPAVKFNGGTSRRMVVKSDNMGFGICETHIEKGGPYHWHYKRHLEACHCVSGQGLLTNLETKESFQIKPGICYLLDNHDNHEFTAYNDVVLISVFNPPLIGNETHDENGNY